MAGAQVGGAEAFFVSLSAALARAGVTVHAALRPNAIRERALAAAGVPYDRVAFGGMLDFWSPIKLGAIARAFRPDVALAFAGRASAHMPKGDYV